LVPKDLSPGPESRAGALVDVDGALCRGCWVGNLGFVETWVVGYPLIRRLFHISNGSLQESDLPVIETIPIQSLTTTLGFSPDLRTLLRRVEHLTTAEIAGVVVNTYNAHVKPIAAV